MGLLVTVLLCSYLSVSLGQTPSRDEAKYLLLPSSAAHGIINHRGSWTPEKPEIAELEASIAQISKLQASNWTFALHIERPERYFRQYVPLLREGHKIFYVSAFCDDPPPTIGTSD